MSFFSFSEADLTGPERLLWKTGDIVKFKCLDFTENAQSGDLRVKCKVLNTEHAGKDYELYVSNRPNEIAQKMRRTFALAFWTKEELVTGEAKPAKLIGRVFTAKSRVSPPKTADQTPYQNWEGFKDEGPDDSPTDAFTTEDGTPRF